MTTSSEPSLDELNTSELLDILRRSPYGFLRLRRGLDRERLIHLIETYELPRQEEYADTMESRRILQAGIRKMWIHIESQLPCKGPLRSSCTVYPCTDQRHVECYIAAQRSRVVTK